LMFFFNNPLKSQEVHPWYWDGQVYVNMERFHDLGGFNEEVPLKEVPFIDERFLEKFGIERVRKPFYRATDPLISRTYQVYFNKPEKVYELIRVLEQLPFVSYAEQVPIL